MFHYPYSHLFNKGEILEIGSSESPSIARVQLNSQTSFESHVYSSSIMLIVKEHKCPRYNLTLKGLLFSEDRICKYIMS